MPRTELEASVHRLANSVECQLVDIFRDLLAESRPGAVAWIAMNANELIEALRGVGSGKEHGGEE